MSPRACVARNTPAAGATRAGGFSKCAERFSRTFVSVAAIEAVTPVEQRRRHSGYDLDFLRTM